MKWDNFGHLTQAQQIAMVIGARCEASYKGNWYPIYQIIAGPNTTFRVHPDDLALELQAKEFLKNL